MLSGASSSKWFTALIIIMCISGMFGSFRWFKVGDADLEEAVLVKTIDFVVAAALYSSLSILSASWDLGHSSFFQPLKLMHPRQGDAHRHLRFHSPSRSSSNALPDFLKKNLL
jgi:hypothetical protein